MNHPQKTYEKNGKSQKWIIFFGIYSIVFSLILVSLVFQLWPVNTTKTVQTTENTQTETPQGTQTETPQDTQTKTTQVTQIKTNEIFSKSSIFGIPITLNPDSRIIILVLLIGALGSYIHAVTSFVTYVGNQRFVDSWRWWYILRPFIGMCLALIFYFVIRGGFISMGSDATSLNIYGLAAVSGLVGMFSKQATDKLQELFDSMFKTKKGEGDDARKNKLTGPISVKELMIPLNKITFYTIPEGKEDKDIKISELFHMFKGIVTRLPILNPNSSIRYVIHQSLLSQFIASKTFAAESGKEQKGLSELKELTLADLVASPGIKAKIQDSLIFVDQDESPSEAKLLMDKTDNCQDVFVTENGEPGEPVKGWLTNIELSKIEESDKN